MRRVRNRLRECLEANYIPARDLAHLSGVPYHCVTRVIKKQGNLSLPQATALAAILGVEPDELFWLEPGKDELVGASEETAG
jgi:plasmid maintenance system antidote protein VapI